MIEIWRARQDRAVADARYAYEIALKHYDVVVELFWKRANYFWLFVAASLTSYGLLLRFDDEEIELWLPRLIVVTVGALGSFCWWLVIVSSIRLTHVWLRRVEILEGRATIHLLHRGKGQDAASRDPSFYNLSSTQLAADFALVVNVAWIAILVAELVLLNVPHWTAVAFSMVIVAAIAAVLFMRAHRARHHYPSMSA